MSIKCDVIVQWNATPEQLSALGAALWRWCTRAPGQTGAYQRLDNQALADLIAGKLPTSRQAERGVHLYVRDEISQNRRATIDSLRREMPAVGLVDIMVDGASWNLAA
jgi:hypothetical protein